MSVINDPVLGVMYLTESPVTEGEIDEKIQNIRTILENSPELYEFSSIAKRIVTFAKNSGDERAVQLMREVLQKHCVEEEEAIFKIKIPGFVPESEKQFLKNSLSNDCAQIEGQTLTFNEKNLRRLEKIPFWKEVQDNGVKELVIHTNKGETITYEGKILELLIERKPLLESLVKSYDLLFDDGKLTLTQAKLLLCGNHFEGLFRSGMTETRGEEIDLRESPVNFYSFMKILQALEFGEDFEDLEECFKAARSYLLFQFREFPEGCFGPVEWEKNFGLIIRNPPPVPNALIQKWNNSCPFEEDKKVSETHALFLVPRGISLRKMNKLAAHPNVSDKSSYPYLYTTKEPFLEKEIPIYDEEIEESYWVLMKKEPSQMTVEESQELVYCSRRVSHYELPSVLEVILGVVLPYVLSGEVIFREHTRCKEGPGYLAGFQYDDIGVKYVSLQYDDNWADPHKYIAPVYKPIIN